MITYTIDPATFDRKLMLTQETQTENRSLIKYLLTLINDTIMRQIEEQSVQMTNQQFKETVDLYKEAIPSVYNQVKEQSDTFFVEQQLGPSYTTAHLQVTQDLANYAGANIHSADNLKDFVDTRGGQGESKM